MLRVFLDFVVYLPQHIPHIHQILLLTLQIGSFSEPLPPLPLPQPLLLQFFQPQLLLFDHSVPPQQFQLVLVPLHVVLVLLLDEGQTLKGRSVLLPPGLVRLPLSVRGNIFLLWSSVPTEIFCFSLKFLQHVPLDHVITGFVLLHHIFCDFDPFISILVFLVGYSAVVLVPPAFI